MPDRDAWASQQMAPSGSDDESDGPVGQNSWDVMAVGSVAMTAGCLGGLGSLTGAPISAVERNLPSSTMHHRYLKDAADRHRSGAYSCENSGCSCAPTPTLPVFLQLEQRCRAVAHQCALFCITCVLVFFPLV